jgi:hypothetical protein
MYPQKWRQYWRHNRNPVNDQDNDENQPNGIIVGDINNLTTILYLKACAEGEEEQEFDDDNASDRSYIPKDDDSTLSGDHDLPEYHQDNQPQGYHEDQGVDVDNNMDQGVDRNNDEDSGVGEINQPQDKENDPMLEELNVVEDANDMNGEINEDDDVKDDNNDISDVDKDPSIADKEKRSPKRRVGLDGTYWNKKGEANYYLSIIKGYVNLEATLSTPQYGFKKGLTIFGGPGYDATVKELDENLIGRDVIQMLQPNSVTYGMFSMLLSYLIF